MIDKETLDALNDQSWPEIILKLKGYAINKVHRLIWRRGRQSLPIGYETADLANKAIEQVWLGERKWNREKQPDLLKFLMNAVDSIVNNLVECAEHKYMSNSSADEIHEKNHPALATPIVDCDNKIDYPKLFRAIHTCAKGDEDLELILLYLEEGKKPKEIADECGLEREKVYQLIRKLKRRVEKAGIKIEQFTVEEL